MGRRNRGGDDGMSLFPFLSILVCLIGVLTLMIVGVSIAQMDTPDIDALLRGEEIEQVEKQLDKETARKAMIEELIKKAEALRKQLEDAKAQLERLEKLEKGKEAQEKLQADAVDLLARIKQLEDRMATLNKELTTLLEEITKLEAELAKRKKPPAAAAVQIKPSGTAKLGGPNGLKTTFVECMPQGVNIFLKDQIIFVRYADMAKPDKPFMTLLKKNEGNKKQTLTFLIRDDAVNIYYYARNLANQNWAYNSKLPIIGKGKIDLSLFKIKK